MNKKNVQLVWELAKTDFKVRYQGSVFGYFWSLLKPLLIFAVLYTVFSVFIRWDVPNFQLHLLLGIIIWTFFADGTKAGLNSLMEKSGIIKKIYFPRILVVLSSVLSAFLTFLLNILIYFVFLFISGVGFYKWMIFIPFYLLLLFFLVFGFALILSVLQSKYRDVTHIWDVLLQAGFFITPIIYPLSFVPEQFRSYLFINPLTGFIEYLRLLTINGELPSMYESLYMVGFIAVIMSFGLLIFNKLSFKVIEEL